jgi:hypothetical protein
VRFIRAFESLSLGVLISCAFFGCALESRAERNTDVETSWDFIGGAGNQVGSRSQLQKKMSATASMNPSLSLQSKGKHSELALNYALNAERGLSHSGNAEISHAFTTTWSAQPNKRFHVRFSDTLNSASDFTMTNVLKGFTFTSTGFQYAFEPHLYKQSVVTNTAALGLDIYFGKQSYLTFGASGSYLNYAGDIQPSGFLSDQFRIEGNMAYSYKSSRRQTWSVKYSAYRNEIHNFDAALSHSAVLAYNQELRPTIFLNVEAGPSYTGKTKYKDDYVSYVASLNISKTFSSNRLSFFYSRRSGDSTGLGSTSDSHQTGLGISRSLGRKTSINFDASAFKQNQGEYRGLHGSTAIARSLSRNLLISLGGSFQTYKGQSAASLINDNKRLFISLAYRNKSLFGK